MKRRILPFAGTGLLLTIIILAVYSSIVAGNPEKSSGKNTIDALENAIIIRGLKMHDENAAESDDSMIHEGAIIYDESFDDNLKEPVQAHPEKNTRQKISRKAMKSRNGETLLRELKNTDPRWHTTEYKIKKGDNLWSIAKKFHTTYKIILEVNEIDDPDKLNPGKLVRIAHRGGMGYEVKRGDSLKSISLRFVVPVNRIVEHNRLNNANAVLKPGMTLFLPDAVRTKRIKEIKNSGDSETRICLKKEKMEFSWPVHGKITSSFGNRMDPFSRTRKFHCGIDISVEPETPVKAAANGKVIFSGWKDGYGNMVVIKHENGYITVYAHNKSNIAAVDDEILKGDTIALSGMTGAVTGAHVHFEIRKYLTALNPLRLMR